MIKSQTSSKTENSLYRTQRPQGCLALVFALLTTLSLGSAYCSDLISNGGMEVNGGNGTIPTGWNLIVNSFGAYNGLHHSGSYCMHVGGGGANGGEYQDIATIAGGTYTLNFWGAPFGSGTESGQVQVGTPGSNNNDLALNNNAEYVNSTFSVTGGWTFFTHTFTATTATTRVSFQNIAPSAVNVDDVSVVSTNEPSITDSPQSQEALTGDNVSFSVTATGTGTLAYQWYFGTGPLSGKTSSTLSLTGVTTNSAGNYFCVVTNNFGSATSAVATLAVDVWGLVRNGGMELNTGNGTIPASWNLIVNSFGAYSGLHHSGSWCMHVGNSGAQGGEYQNLTTAPGQKYTLSFWGRPFSGPGEMGRVKVGTPGASDTDLSLNNNAEFVDAIFTNAVDWTLFTYVFTATSATTRVTFINEPTYVASGANVDDVKVLKFVSVAITSEPASQSADCTSNATFTVSATGTPPYTYQWYYNGAPVSQQTSAALNLTNLNTCQAGSYTVVVGDAAPSTATSVVAVLTVTCSGLVQDGGFEASAGNGTPPAGWLDIANSFGAFSFWGQAHSGAYGMHGGAFSGDGGMYQDLATVPGKQYNFSVYAASWPFYTNANQCRIQVGTPGTSDNDLTLNNNHEYVDVTAIVPVYLNFSSWTRFSYLFTATAAVTRVSLQNVATPEGSAVTFDDVLIEPAPKVTVTPVGAAYKISMLGTPGRVYHIQRASALPGPFGSLVSITCPPSGLVEYTDNTPPPGGAFYRVETGSCP